MEFQYEGFGLGRRIKNTSRNNWDPLNPDVYLINSPTVLVVGGSGTEGVRGANGNAKIVESLLNYADADAEILSMYYNGKIPTEGMMEFYSRRFARDLFAPLLCSGNVDAACKNMRNVTIFAHSMGGQIVQSMIAELKEMMKKYHYQEADISKILRQIFVVSYGVTMVSSNINHLNIISPADELFADSGETCWKMLIMKLIRTSTLSNEEKHNLTLADLINIPKQDAQYLLNQSLLLDNIKHIREFYNLNNRCYVMQEGKNELRLVTSPLRISHKDHAITQFFRNKDGSQNINATLTGDMVSKCLAYALRCSVKNSIKNSASQNFEPLDLIKLRQGLEKIVAPLNAMPIVEPSNKKEEEHVR